MAYWRSASAAVLLGLAPAPCLGILRDLGLTVDSVDDQHLAQGGSCESGCVRTVVDSVAVSLGEVDCDLPVGGLRVENLLDHVKEDVMGGALNVVHYCSNADGKLLYAVRDGGVGCLFCFTSPQRQSSREADTNYVF